MVGGRECDERDTGYGIGRVTAVIYACGIDSAERRFNAVG